ncbi:MAG: hypothetical protein ACI8X5_000104 [Planctomycetota bacterium]|jgi:hypothetical protein
MIASRTGRPIWASLATLAACATLLFAACQTIPKAPGAHVHELYHGDLETVAPMDIVVAPILDDSVDGGVPDLELRRAFQRELIVRRYSALALPYTDRRVVNAAYQPGALYEDAILQVKIRKWDLSRWKSNSEVSVIVEAWMLSAEDERELWGGRLERTFYLETDMSKRATEKGAFEKTAQSIAQELMEVMPARSPQP